MFPVDRYVAVSMSGMNPSRTVCEGFCLRVIWSMFDLGDVKLCATSFERVGTRDRAVPRFLMPQRISSQIHAVHIVRNIRTHPQRLHAE